MIRDFIYRWLGMLPRDEVERRITSYLAPRFSATATDILRGEFRTEDGRYEIDLGRLTGILAGMKNVAQCTKHSTRFMHWRLIAYGD